MNHRRSPRGYHRFWTSGIFGMLALASCVPLRPLPEVSPQALPGEPWRDERAAVVRRINAARAAANLAPVAYDSLLERVGDEHCRDILAEHVEGHFSLSGVPPYLRYLLAGGSGYHRENAASFSSTRPVALGQLTTILLTSVERMLEEVAPHDGHRRTILDPWATHVGIGLAWQGGGVRASHEFAVLVTEEWTPLPPAVAPRTTVSLSGRLQRPWEPEALEVLWEELPRPREAAELRTVHSYGYPPRRVAFFVKDQGANFGTGMPVASVAVDKFRSFTFRWQIAPFEGVEIAVVWARHGSGRDLVQVAASATVVTDAATLPPALQRWRTLGERGGVSVPSGPSPARDRPTQRFSRSSAPPRNPVGPPPVADDARGGR